MSLAVTIIGDDQNYDVRLPSDVPLALLGADLQQLTGMPTVALTRGTGELLDPELSLIDNAVRDGAILQVRTRDDDLAVYDDIVDLATAETTEVRSVSASMFVAATAAATTVVFIGCTTVVLGLLAAAAVVLSAFAPRAAIRLTRITPQTDARSAAARSRTTLAKRTSFVLEHTLAIVTLAAGVALVSAAGTFAVIAGWCCIALIACRAPLPAGAPPAAALAMHRLAALLTALTPALAITASGLVPGLPT